MQVTVQPPDDVAAQVGVASTSAVARCRQKPASHELNSHKQARRMKAIGLNGWAKPSGRVRTVLRGSFSPN